MNRIRGRYYDAHNHLHDERFGGRQDEIIAEAQKAGVARMVVNGSSEKDWPQVLDLARRYPEFIIPSWGLHPWYVPERTRFWESELVGYLDTIPSVIGEIGLDRWKPDLPWDDQQEVFRRQFDIAASLGLPVTIHCLKAWGPLVEIIERSARPFRGFLLHSYSGSAELVDRLAPLGAYFSLPGYYAREGKEHKRAVFRRVPLDRLLIETDAPDQSLPDDRNNHPLTDADGRAINHPANLGAVYRLAAEIYDLPLLEIRKRVKANFMKFFAGFVI